MGGKMAMLSSYNPPRNWRGLGVYGDDGEVVAVILCPLYLLNRRCYAHWIYRFISIPRWNVPAGLAGRIAAVVRSTP